jgi:hypothetical protein
MNVFDARGSVSRGLRVMGLNEGGGWSVDITSLG